MGSDRPGPCAALCSADSKRAGYSVYLFDETLIYFPSLVNSSSCTLKNTFRASWPPFFLMNETQLLYCQDLAMLSFAGTSFCIRLVSSHRPCRRSSRQRCWLSLWRRRSETRSAHWKWRKPGWRRGRAGPTWSSAGTTRTTGAVAAQLRNLCN